MRIREPVSEQEDLKVKILVKVISSKLLLLGQ